MRFLIDAQLPPALARLLNNRAHVAEHVNDVGLAESPDRNLWRYALEHYALEHGAVTVTKDEDFANMAALGGDAPTIMWLRGGNTRSAAQLAWFEPLVDEVVSLVSRRAIGSSNSAEPTPMSGLYQWGHIAAAPGGRPWLGTQASSRLRTLRQPAPRSPR